MRKELFDKLNSMDLKKNRVIVASDLSPYAYDRTLLYGYTCERETFHVYLKNGKIYTVAYKNDFSTGVAKPKNMRQIIVSSNFDYIPDKRLYPERCEYNFCVLLKERGIHLPFTAWNGDIDTAVRYHGFTLEDE